MESGKFLPGGASLEGRQFEFSMEGALAYAETDSSKVAILRATIQRSALPQLDFPTSIDPFIFRNGVVTVEPGAQSDIVHAALVAIERVF
jgi:filamentous hemagglutinin